MARNGNTITLDYSEYVAKEFKFTQNDIDNLMVTALEGGIEGWAISATEKKINNKLINVYDLSDVISRGGEILIHTVENEKLLLNHEKFMKGLEMEIIDSGCENVEEFMNNHDADTADNIIQFALFGEIMFS